MKKRYNAKNRSMSHEKPVDALLVADYLLFKAKKEGKQITNKKLQKLLYYSQAWNAAINNRKVFTDKIEAWIHGPAIKSVYLEFQKFGANYIEKDVDSKKLVAIPEGNKKLIDQVWDVYSKYDAGYLELLTHSEDPWIIARNNLEPHISSENEITFESMRDFYKKKIVAK